MRPRPWLILVMAGAAIGLLFAGLSTYDFMRHLDRQVHSIHCSFIPGAGADLGGSGCQTAMMSPYSSVLRSTVWGGIPISLPAMSVFAFILFFAADLVLSRRQDDRRATGFLALATALPALASVVMLIISITQLGETCKLCVAIYVSSGACLLGAIVLWRQASGVIVEVPATAPPPNRDEDPAWASGKAAPAPRASLTPARTPAPRTSNQVLATAFGIGVLMVGAPVVLYVALAPEHERFIGTCDGLAYPEDTYGVMVPIGDPSGGVPAIELLDPLCPSCKAFEQRLGSSGLDARLARRAVLFPLDDTCNWMVTEAMHPGACTVSEAVLCAGDRANEVIAWAFEMQEQIRTAAKDNPEAAAHFVAQRFPELASCVGSPEAKSKLNKSLRWAVSNGVKVMTPQLYIDNVRLCDEDIDLGLEFALTEMIARHERGALVATEITTPPPMRAPIEPAPAAAAKPVEEGTAAPEDPTEAVPAEPTPAAEPTTAPKEEATPSKEPPKPPQKEAAEPAKEPAAEPAKEPAAEPAAEPAKEPAAEPAPPTPTEPEAPSAGGQP